MIRIIISPIYEIQVDTQNHVVVKNSVGKSGKSLGKQTQTVLGYYQNIKPCLEKIAKDMITSQEIELGSLEQYKNLIEETMNYYLSELENYAEKIEKAVRKK